MNLARWYDTMSSLYALIPYHLFPSRALPPLHLFVELTYRCHLKCRMCQFLPLLTDGDLERRRGEELSTKEVLAFVRAFPRTAVVTFTGGEPLLRKDLPDILGALAPRNKVHIITNGTLLNESAVNMLMSHRLRSLLRGGLMAIGVSLHGTEEIHDAIVGMKGAYRKACAGIGLVNAMKKKEGAAFPHVHVTCVITETNAPVLSEIYRAARDMGTDYCNFTIVTTGDFTSRIPGGTVHDYESAPPPGIRIDPDILRAQFDKMDELARDSSTGIRFSPFGMSRGEIIAYYQNKTDVASFRCMTPWRMFGITAYGDISSCPYTTVGNIRTDALSRIWNGPAQRRFRQDLRKRGIFPICLGCCASNYVEGQRKPG